MRVLLLNFGFLAGWMIAAQVSAYGQKSAFGQKTEFGHHPSSGLKPPVDYFISPLEGTLQLSGTFAELRGNHFHSGIDIRTNSKEGYPVYACADGYVVRIKVAPGGFGKAIYINHPNGFTTVYAHLQGFNPAITEWLTQQQYKLEQFDVDLFPPRNLLGVKKGEIIAYSGNSGASEGPHLHFEVRETHSEYPIDPLLCKLPVKDFIRPTINGLRIYPEDVTPVNFTENATSNSIGTSTGNFTGNSTGYSAGYSISNSTDNSTDNSTGNSTGNSIGNSIGNYTNNQGKAPVHFNSTINGKAEPITLALAGWGPVYRLKISDTIEVAGNYSLAVSADDLLNESGNRNGINGYVVYLDSVEVFNWQAKRFSFDETRYINSFIDYPFYYSTNRRFMRTHTDPNNKLSMYVYNPYKGIFSSLPAQLQSVKIVITDSNGNESILRFMVKGTGPVDPVLSRDNLTTKPTPGKAKTDYGADKAFSGAAKPYNGTSKPINGTLFTINTLNHFSTPKIRISLPGKCLYDSIRFVYSETPRLVGMLCETHHIHQPDTPLQDYFDLTLRTDTMASVSTDKLVLVRLNYRDHPVYAGGHYENGLMKARVREFGKYTVMADTTAPVIKPVNVKEGMKVSALRELRFRISDNFSGINTYRGTLNGAWILMDYDAKNRLLTYKRDARLLPGENILLITTTDGRNNATAYRITLYL